MINRMISFLIISLSFTSFIYADNPKNATQEKSIAERIADRDFPSVFQAWNGIDSEPGKDRLMLMARHDLMWHSVGGFGLRWDSKPSGLAQKITPESIASARKMRQQLLKRNPNMILIAEIRYRDAHRRFLTDNHPWWLRDEQGKLAQGWKEGNFLKLDFHHPDYQRHVARRAQAVIETNAVDGILLDWWHDDNDRLALIREIRHRIGDQPLIIANANDRITPRTAPYINGYFMECYRSQSVKDWERIRNTLVWAEEHLRAPRVNCLETWFHQSRRDLNLMRATTTLVLTCSNGYCLFSDPNPLPTPDHRHNWYPFWNRSLGKPVSEGTKQPNGSFRQEYEHGTVVYNPMGNQSITITFPQPRKSLATGQISREHKLSQLDGDIFLHQKTH